MGPQILHLSFSTLVFLVIFTLVVTFMASVSLSISGSISSMVTSERPRTSNALKLVKEGLAATPTNHYALGKLHSAFLLSPYRVQEHYHSTCHNPHHHCLQLELFSFFGVARRSWPRHIQATVATINTLTYARQLYTRTFLATLLAATSQRLVTLSDVTPRSVDPYQYSSTPSYSSQGHTSI
jgi:hypothetical protein